MNLRNPLALENMASAVRELQIETVDTDSPTAVQSTQAINPQRTSRLERHKLRIVQNELQRRLARDFDQDFYRALNVA